MPGKNIEALFDTIAPSYDRLNHILSFGADWSWRKRAVKATIDGNDPLRVLDVACGTADITIALARRMKKNFGKGMGEKGKVRDEDISEGKAHTNGEENNAGIREDGRKEGCGTVIGVDLSENMLEIGREKVAKAGLSACVTLGKGDGESLQFGDGSFDRVTIAFGIRNFSHIDKGLREMCRVLAPCGKLVVLELSVPQNAAISWLYKIYFLKILPWLASLFSGDKGAYTYLPASVLRFPSPDEFCEMMREAGFEDIRHKALTLGICRMYIGHKK